MSDVGASEAAGSALPALAADVRLRALGTAVAGIRQRLASGAAPDSAALEQLLGAMRPLPTPRAGGGAAIESALIALLDEICGLVGQLEAERGAIAASVQALGRHRQAKVAYGIRRQWP